MKIALVLTNDWELFGDGSGDYFDVQHKVLNEFLEFQKDSNANITLMAETLQQIEHIKFSSKYSNLLPIVEAWEEIVVRSIEQGNDVQLHIHPQWIGANYNGEAWRLDMTKTAIGQIPIEDIEYCISKGQKYLYDLIQARFPNYICNVFRAGAYCIEPSANVLQILDKYGIIADCSVTKGLTNEGFFDFSNVPSNWESWRTSPLDIKTRGEGLLEIPIYSTNSLDSQVLKKFAKNLYYRLKYNVNVPKSEVDWLNEKERIKEIKYPRANRYYKANKKKNLSFYINAFLGLNNTQLDYDYLPATVFLKIIENLYKQLENQYKDDDITIPIIASGHFKDIHNLNNLKKIIILLNEKMANRLEFCTISQAVELLIKKT